MRLVAIVFSLLMIMKQFELPCCTKTLFLHYKTLFLTSSLKKLDWDLFTNKLIMHLQLKISLPNFSIFVVSLIILFFYCTTIEYHNCMKKGHNASNQRRQCKTPRHLIQNYPIPPPHSYQNRNKLSPNSLRPALTTVVATNSSIDSSQAAFSVIDLESLLSQFLPSGNTYVIFSTMPVNSKWYFDISYCNHTTFASNLFTYLFKNNINIPFTLLIDLL